MPSPGSASQSSEEVDAAGFAELLNMLNKGRLPVVPGTKEKLDGIAEHLFYVNGDNGLPGRICTVQDKGDRLAIGCIEGQYRHNRPSDHIIHYW